MILMVIIMMGIIDADVMRQTLHSTNIGTHNQVNINANNIVFSMHFHSSQHCLTML